MTVSIEIVDDPAQACADLMLAACVAHGCTQIVLAGGSTPKAANEIFARTVRRRRLSLGDVAFWLGDDRAVGPDDPNSNYGMIRATLLEPLADLTKPLMHRIEGELGYAVAADHYEQCLRHSGVDISICCCWGSAPTDTRCRCLPASRRCTSVGGSSSACPRPEWSRSCRGCRSR